VEKVKVPYNYLGYQFIPSGDLVRDILADIGKLVETTIWGISLFPVAIW